MKKQTYTLIYKIQNLGKSFERHFDDLRKAKVAEYMLYRVYGDDIEVLILK